MDILHPSRPNISRADLSERLATLYKTDKNRVVTFGLRTQFGGGRSTGFALIYDDEAAQKKFEPKYRLVRVCCFPSSLLFILSLELQSGLAKKVEKASRKLRKERKNRAKKVIQSSGVSPLIVSNDAFSLVPWYQKIQGGRAPQEGWEVDIGCAVFYFPYMHRIQSPQQSIINFSLHVGAKNVKMLNCTKGNIWVFKMKRAQGTTFKNQTFCELHLDLLGTPRQIPTSGFIS